VAAELPGRARRFGEAHATSLAGVAAELADGLGGAARSPWIFVGHSMGAVLAYETAMSLRERGAPAPLGLIAVARGAPDGRAPGDGLPGASASETRDYLEGLEGTPAAILENADYMSMVAKILRADFELLRGYVHRPRPPLAMPLHVIGALRDAAVGFESLLGWGRLFDGEQSLTMVDGGHFAPIHDPSTVFRKAYEIVQSSVDASAGHTRKEMRDGYDHTAANFRGGSRGRGTSVEPQPGESRRRDPLQRRLEARR
jgi:surfactin synthase thioesterase subunit